MADKEPEEIRGILLERSKEEGWNATFTVLPDPDLGFPKNHTVTVSGAFRHLSPGLRIRGKGEKNTDAKNMIEFSLRTAEYDYGKDKEAVATLLTSGDISSRGISREQAEAIYDRLGENTLALIHQDPKHLLEAPELAEGVGKFTLKRLAAATHKFSEIRKARKASGLTEAQCAFFYNSFNDSIVNSFLKGPFQYASVLGMTYKQFENVSQKLGFKIRPYQAVYLAARNIVAQIQFSGSTCRPIHQLRTDAGELIDRGVAGEIAKMTGVNPAIIPQLLAQETFRGDYETFMHDGVAMVQSKGTAELERGIAKELRRLCESAPLVRPPKGDITLVDPLVDKEESQKSAVMKILGSGNFGILTGGAGVGKTAVAKCIVAAVEEQAKRDGVVLRIVGAAPSAQAAERLKESIGLPCKTMHQLTRQGYDGRTHTSSKKRVRENLIILDEFSMVDLQMMLRLLQAIETGTKVIILGDPNQLEAVGYGRVLKDLLDSGVIPSAHLWKTFRNSGQIPVAAKQIVAGVVPEISDEPKPDDQLHFIKANGDPAILANIVETVKALLSVGTPAGDIQILSPQNEGEVGVSNINEAVRNLLNPPPEDGQHNAITMSSGLVLCEGDRVTNTVNDKKLEISNAETGIIKHVDARERMVRVQFGERLVTMKDHQISRLVLGYCTTVHKSQGSAYPEVIVPITKSHLNTLTWMNLMTAITRVRNKCYLVGSKEAFKEAILNRIPIERKTGLSSVLRKELSDLSLSMEAVTPRQNVARHIPSPANAEQADYTEHGQNPTAAVRERNREPSP